MKVDVQVVSMQGAMENISGVREIPENTTAAMLLSILEMPVEEQYAFMVNDIPVALPDRVSRILDDGDKITIFPPIRGG